MKSCSYGSGLQTLTLTLTLTLTPTPTLTQVEFDTVLKHLGNGDEGEVRPLQVDDMRRLFFGNYLDPEKGGEEQPPREYELIQVCGVDWLLGVVSGGSWVWCRVAPGGWCMRDVKDKYTATRVHLLSAFLRAKDPIDKRRRSEFPQ